MNEENGQNTAEELQKTFGFSVLYEDNHIIVVLKPQNVASCPDDSGDDNLLDMVRRYLKTVYHKPGNVYVGLVHRLDRPTGGVMVYAKTSKAASRLSESLRRGDFEKRYLTVLCGTFEAERGSLTDYLKKNPVNNMVYICTRGDEGAKEATLDYAVLQTRDRYTLAEVRLHTGRSHQIRVQMAGASHPVFGDMRYGGANAQKGKLALWAYSLSFTHPVHKERMRFIALPPEEEVPWKNFDLSQIGKVR